MEPYTLFSLIGTFIGGGASMALIAGFFARAKNKAEAEVTLGDGWEKFASKLEQRVIGLENDNASLRKELRDITGAYFDQQRTIAKQQEKIAEQETKIHEQQEEINILREELLKFSQPVNIIPAT